MSPGVRRPRLYDLVTATIAGGTLIAAVQIFGNGLVAQDGSLAISLNNPGETLSMLRDSPWGASVGFITIPSARALASRPRWEDPAAPSAEMDREISLAVVGLPIDLDHAMLQSNRADTYCLARQSATEQSAALCGKKSSEYTLLKSSTEYNLCGFTDDCWHSTAAAVLASGKGMDKKLFSFEALAALPFRDGTKNVQERGDDSTPSDAPPPQGTAAADQPPDDPADSTDSEPMRFPQVPNIYYSAKSVPGLIWSRRELSGEGPPSKERQEEANERRQYEKLPRSAFPLVELYGTTPHFSGNAIPTLVNRNIVVNSGRRPGGALYAVNVFSRVEDKQICAAAARKAPCVLTNLIAQEKALESILIKAREEKSAAGANSSARPRIGAILIIAGGPLTDKPCDSSATAQHIKALRQLGIFTFIPAGNDGKATQVRFPGCASDAITVGALNRDGKVSPFSNGRSTSMVKLYTDGDSLALPIRALPAPGLACMPPDRFAEIVKGYETVLVKLRHLTGAPRGVLDTRVEEAVMKFQKATRGLPQSGKLDGATLAALEGYTKKKKSGDDTPDFVAISSNVKSSNFADLSVYRDHLCKDGDKENFYQAQFVSGTLASAAIAAGQFMALLDEYKQMSTADVYSAVNTVASKSQTRELDLRAVNGFIRSAVASRNPSAK